VELDTESGDSCTVSVTEFDSPTNLLFAQTPLIFSTLINEPQNFGEKFQKQTFSIDNNIIILSAR